MKAGAVEYVRPESVDAAVDLLAQLGEDAKILAGGQSLLPVLNLRLARPAVLVDIGRVSELKRIQLEPNGQGLTIGALTTHRAIETGSAAELSGYRHLSGVAELIGHLPIRTRGTIGGSLAHADSAAEWPLAALALDCTIHVRGRRGSRQIDVNHFFQGPFTTALAPDEILTGVHFPRSAEALNVVEFARRKGDFALVAAAANLRVVGGRCHDARIVVGGVAGEPRRFAEAEAVLDGCRLSEPSELHAAVVEAAQLCSGQIDPPNDVHASSAYRKRLARVLVERALLRSVDDLGENR